MHKNKIFDDVFFNSIVGEDEEFKKELITLFFSQSKEIIEKIKLASNKKELFLHSHSLKGCSASVGAYQLSIHAELIQKMCSHNKSLPNNLLEDLDTIYSKTKAEIQLKLQ